MWIITKTEEGESVYTIWIEMKRLAHSCVPVRCEWSFVSPQSILEVVFPSVVQELLHIDG